MGGGGKTSNYVIAFAAALASAAAMTATADDLELTDDRVLSEDLTVEGNVIMSQGVKLDLNGHVLTAQGVDGDPSAEWTETTDDLTSPSGKITMRTVKFPTSSEASNVLFDNGKTFDIGSGLFKEATHTTSIIIYGVGIDNKVFWVIYDFGENNRRTITGYKVYMGLKNSTADQRKNTPKDWELQGSNDNENWTAVDSRSGETWTADNATSGKSYSCANPGAYRYYRYYCTASNHTAGNVVISELEYFGTVSKPIITDTSTEAPGKLRLAVSEGTTLTNSKVVINGNLDFVKDGDGTYTCATADLMTYLGDTYIEGGKFLCGLNGSKHPFGGGNIVVNGDFENVPSDAIASTSTYTYYTDNPTIMQPWSAPIGGGITKKGGGSFDGNSYANGAYGAFLHGAGVTSQEYSRRIEQTIFVRQGEYKWSFRYGPRKSYEGLGLEFNLFNLDDWNNNLIDQTKQQGNLGYQYVSLNSGAGTKTGTKSVASAGSYILQFRVYTTASNTDRGIVLDDVVFERIPNVHIATGATLDLKGKSGFGNYKFVGEGGSIINSGAAISESLAVSGVFAPVATTGSFGVVLQDGATLNLTKWEGAFPIASPAISFASGATAIAVVLNSSVLSDLKESDYPYLVEWSSQPAAAFTLDETSRGSGYIIIADSTGLRVRQPTGFSMVVR